MIREFSIVFQNADRLLAGLANTVLLAAFGLLLALVLGGLLSALLMSESKSVALPARALVDAMRCIPFLLLAYLVYYALPSIGLNFDNWTSGLLAIVIYNAGYMAEILRGVRLSMQRLPSGSTAGDCLCASSCPRWCSLRFR